MRFEQNGVILWYGTPDAPAPDEVVRATPSGRAIGIALTVGVHPIAASNRVMVRYRVNGGAERTVHSSLARTDMHAKAQYFVARFPELNVGDTVEYTVVCTCAGRQVPSPEEAKKFVSSFRVVEAEANLKPSLASKDITLSQPAGGMGYYGGSSSTVQTVAQPKAPLLPPPPASARVP